MNTTKCVLFGYGYWGRKLYPLLEKHFAEVWVVDPQLANANIPQLTQQQALARSDITSAVVATPEITHYQIIKECLEVGKDVFTEKPLALSSREAQTLIKLAEQHTCRLYVDTTFVFDPAIVFIRQQLQHNDCGNLLKAISLRHSSIKAKPAIGVTDDLLPHDLYLQRWLLGQSPVKFDVVSSHIQQGQAVAAEVRFTFKDTSSWLAQMAWEAEPGDRILELTFERISLLWQKNPHEKVLVKVKGHRQAEHTFTASHSNSPLNQSLAFFLDLEYEPKTQTKLRYSSYIADVTVLEKIRDQLTAVL